MKTVAYKNLLHKKYIQEKKTDKEIAKELGVDRTTIVHARKYHGIPTRESTGSTGEVEVVRTLQERDFNVLNMNKMTKTFPFDLLINHYIRGEVKSSAVCNDKGKLRFLFTLSEKEENNNIATSYRLKFSNGRTRKIYRKTCDFLILCGLSKAGNQFFIIPSSDIPDSQVTIGIPVLDNSQSKYYKYKNNWDLLRR